MCSIHKFPIKEDFEAIRTAVNVFLGSRNPTTRTMMHNAIVKLLERYNLSKIYLQDYYIQRVDNYVRIYPKLIVEDNNCPQCGEPIYTTTSLITIITIDESNKYDTVTYGCGKCHKIFGKKEKTG